MAKPTAAVLIGEFGGTVRDLDDVVMKLHPAAKVDDFPHRKSYTIAEQLNGSLAFVTFTAFYPNSAGLNGNSPVSLVIMQGSGQKGKYLELIRTIIDEAEITVLEKGGSGVTDLSSRSGNIYKLP